MQTIRVLTMENKLKFDGGRWVENGLNRSWVLRKALVMKACVVNVICKWWITKLYTWNQLYLICQVTRIWIKTWKEKKNKMELKGHSFQQLHYWIPILKDICTTMFTVAVFFYTCKDTETIQVSIDVWMVK